uniref:Retrotransposon gag domain-containing protein n=1 Tax=Cannabis sativa TaxID=3483 RepID=A0A803QIC4_CANSA
MYGEQQSQINSVKNPMEDPSNPYFLHHGDNPATIWADLKVRFHQRNGPHIYNLKKGLMNLRQDAQSVGMYFTKLKSIWEELSNYKPTCTCNGCTCGGMKKLQEFHHVEYIISFLMGLSDSYSQVRSSILLMEPLPEINRVFHLVSQEENQKGNLGNANDPNSNMPFAFQKDKNVQNKNDNQGNKSYPPKKGRPFCTHCSIHGHTIERCYKIHRYPPGFNKQTKSKDATANHIQTSNDNNTSSEETHTLLPQLSTAQYQQLLNLLANQQPNVTNSEANTSTVVQQSGTIEIPGDIVLNNVLFNPSFKFNILSETLSKRVIGRGKGCDGLYILEKHIGPCLQSCCHG